MDYAVLKNELLTDPRGYGYATPRDAGNMTALAELLNRPRASIQINRPDVAPLEILEAINVADFKANLNVLMASWFESITQFPSVRILKDNGTDTRVMSNFMAILTNGSQSEARLRALAVRNGSRAEEMFGTGTLVTDYDCAIALNS